MATVRVREIGEEELSQRLRDIRYSGYTVLPRAVDPETVRNFLDLVHKTWEETKDRVYTNLSMNQAQDRFIYNLQYRDKAFIDLLSSSTVERMLVPLLNDPYYVQIPAGRPNYIMTFYNARSSVVRLPLHIDSNIPALGPYVWSMQVILVLNGQNAKNGATTVVPGSHLSGQYTDREYENLTVVNADAGDLIFFDSRLWHGALPNDTGEDRWSLVATLKQWWLKQATDIPRGMPEEIYAQLTDAQKALMGFCSIPPGDEMQRISMKVGYESLLPRVADYWR